MARPNERPPWESGDETAPRRKRPTTRYQQRAIEEQRLENQSYQNAASAPGQGLYSQTSHYARPYGQSYPSATRSKNGGVPWHGIVAILVSLVCWPAGLYVSSKARQSNNMASHHMGTVGYVVSAIGGILVLLRMLMSMQKINLD